MIKKHDKEENAGDQDAGVDSVFYGQIEKSEEQSEVTALDIAIIGYWRMNKERSFECYHSFKITNPMKREVKKSHRKGCTVSIKQFLYHGKNGEIFFFYKNSDPNYYIAH